MNKFNGTIAILGGMGPEASAKMLEVMVSMASKRFGARDGSEFPEIIVDSIPVPEFISNKKKISLALSMLQARVIKLNKFNVSCFGIACNTAHILLDELDKVSSAPFVSMIDSVMRDVYYQGFRRVGLLATSSTIKSKLYQIAGESLNVQIVLPTEQQVFALEKIIRRVISGETTKSDRAILREIGNSLREKGVQGIILGCTEISLVFPKNFTLQTFDSLKILARELLKRSFNTGEVNINGRKRNDKNE